MGLPARGYSWPLFTSESERGNMKAAKHLAFSERAIAPVQAEIIETATELIPFLDDPSYVPALEAWARVEARCRLVADYLDEHGLLDPDGKPRPAADLSIRLEKSAADARARLGLDPTSRARLERDLSVGQRARVDTGVELERARAIRVRAEARMVGEASPQPPDDADVVLDDAQDPQEKAD